MFKRLALATGLGLIPGLAQGAETPPTSPQSERTPIPGPAVASGRDDGRLEEAWFGPAAVFKPGKETDFFWVKPGFDPAGHTIRMQGWEPPVLLFPGRNDKDRQKATELTYFFPIQLRSDLSRALGGKAIFSSSAGDWTLLGRFVDANAGSDVTRLLLPVGPGTASATWDLKIVDSATGDCLLAVHHRCLSGSAFTGIQDKLEKWSRKFAQNLKAGTMR
jgi:hypothetical protein